MEYFKTSKPNIFIKFDPTTNFVQVVDKTELGKLKTHYEQKLAELPTVPADKDLLAWAKANYTSVVGVETSKTLIGSELGKINEDLEGCK